MTFGEHKGMTYNPSPTVFKNRYFEQPAGH